MKIPMLDLGDAPKQDKEVFTLYRKSRLVPLLLLASLDELLSLVEKDLKEQKEP